MIKTKVSWLKSLIAVFICIMICFGTGFTVPALNVPVFSEDVNGDNSLNAEDLTYIVKVLLGIGDKKDADINGDGVTNILDFVRLKKFILNYTDKEKFYAKSDVKAVNKENILLGDLFTLIDGESVDSEKVTVTVICSEGVTYDYQQNFEDWSSSTLKFIGVGTADVYIHEYCDVTHAEINVELADKFVAKNNIAAQEETSLTLGELFDEIADADINSEKVIVETVNCEYSKNENDWKESTVTFTTVGTATVTISEESKPVKADITVTEIPSVFKFNVKFPNTDKYTYRVGNQNSVKLGSLFSKADGVTIKDVSVSGEALDANNSLSLNYTSNASNWEEGTVKFNGTGYIKITISDNDHCLPTELTVEVINATNATTAMSAIKNDVVLLNNMGFSTIEVSGGYTLHGNGFTISSPSDITGDGLSTAYVELNNGTLDNVRVICPNFSHQIMYMSQAQESGNVDPTAEWRYKNIRSAVSMVGKSTISNSYVSGGRAGIFVLGGNATVDNTMVYAGALANIHVNVAQSVTLRDLTLVQQPTKATVNDTTKTKMGFSVVVTCGGDGSSTPITLEGTLNQYAWANNSYNDYFPKNTDTIVEYVMKQDAYKHNFSLHEGDTAQDWLNLGIAYMPADVGLSVNKPTLNDNRTADDKAKKLYDWVKISAIGTETYVYSIKNTNGTDADLKTEPIYNVPNAGAILLPELSFKDTKDGITFSTSFDGQKGWTSTLEVDLDTVGSYSFSFENLVANKNGQALTYTVNSSNGNSIDKSQAIALTGSGVTDYTLLVTDNNGKTIHEMPFTLIAKMTKINPPEKVAEVGGTPLLVVKSKNSDWSCALPALEGTQIKYWSVADKEYKTLALSSLTPTSTGKQNGTNNYWTYPAPNGDYTLTVTCGVIHEGKGVYGMPVVVNNGGNKMYFTISNTNGYVSTSTTARAVTITYEFKDNNGGTLTFDKTWQFNYDDYKNGTQYSYSDFVNGTLKAASGGCVAPDTLVTLADGTKKEIQYVTNNDLLLVWDFYKGEYAVAPASIIFNMGTGNFDVLTLRFSDGTEVRTINGHRFFNKTLNQFVLINESNVADYIGHSFVKMDGNQYITVELSDYSKDSEYTTSYSILSAYHYNFIVEGILSDTFHAEDAPLFDYFKVGNDMKYDPISISTDIENYGLYTYEDFRDYLTYEQFVALNVQYMKISVGKGQFAYDDILALINLYLNK